MPAAAPRSLRLATVLGVLQAAALLMYGLAIEVFELRSRTQGIAGEGADLAPAVLVALYAAFAGLVLLVALLLGRGRRAARTPFLLVQAFAVIIAQALLAAADTRWLGVLLVAVAIAAAAATLAPASRRFLR